MLYKSIKILTLLMAALAAYMIPKFSSAKNIQIEFTGNDSYSIEVARIEVGDSVEWLPTNEGHNVEFFAGPKIKPLPPTSKMDEPHTVVFKVPGIYLYGCTPHANMGMIGLIVVSSDLHNLEAIKKIQLSPVATSVLKRLLKIAETHSNPL